MSRHNSMNAVNRYIALGEWSYESSKTEGYGITVYKEKSQHQLKEHKKSGIKSRKHTYAQGKEGSDQRSTGELKEPNPSAPLPSSGRSISVGIHAKTKWSDLSSMQKKKKKSGPFFVLETNPSEWKWKSSRSPRPVLQFPGDIRESSLISPANVGRVQTRSKRKPGN